ncbi:MAG: 50S ribosomal protein L30 [Thermoplasmata archaeon]
MTSWIVIRVRGTIHARRDIEETLRFLHLTRPNHATVVPDRPELRGMLYKVQGYVTWGEASPETVTLLLSERGVTTDGRAVSAPAPEGQVALSIDDLSKSTLANGLYAVGTIRPLFRLKAPKGGWRSTKKPFRSGGALGYRGTAINDLARRMV